MTPDSAHQRRPSELEVTRRDLGPICLLVVRGEVDVARSRRLGSEINEALGARPRRLVIDLSDTTFVNSTGPAVLVHARRRALRAGIELRLVSDVPSALRALPLTQLDRTFDVHQTREDALR